MSTTALPTIRDVAQLAGVSVATVSKALNGTGRVSAVLTDRVTSAARALGYAPHASARSLRSGESRILGLLVADIANPFFLTLVEHIERIASSAGYSVILCNSGEQAEREERHLQMLLAQRTDGIILIPTRASWVNRIGALSQVRSPVVLVDRLLAGLDADSVTVNNRLVGRLAGQHLFERGHRRAGIIMGSNEHAIARHRLDGFREAFSVMGVGLDEALVSRDCFSEEDAFAAAMRMIDLPDPPSAVFATNNHLALGLMRAVVEKGRRVPQDISLVTVDDLPWARIVQPGMTVVLQPSETIAQAAVDTVLDRITRSRAEAPAHKARSLVFDPQLLVRGSTRSLGDGP